MRKLIVLLTTLFSCHFAQGQDSIHSGFEIGLTAAAYNGLMSSYFMPEFYTTPGLQIFNGLQMNFNLDRITFRGHFNYSNDGTRCTNCSGGDFFVKNRQLKIGLQYYLRKKMPGLYSFFDISATQSESFGGYSTGGTRGVDEPYTFESDMKGWGWDAGFGYKLKVFRNFSVASEVGINTIDGRTNGEWIIQNHGTPVSYYYRYKEVWFGARLILLMKIK
jgi:hypothetical protein